MGTIFGSDKPSQNVQVDAEAERRRQEAEAKARQDKADLEAKQREEDDAIRRGLRGRRALQGSGGELGYAAGLGAG